MRPLPPLAQRPRSDGLAGARDVPLLDRLAAGAARRAGEAEPARRRVLPAARRRAARARDRAGGDARPLGPAERAPGGGRLGGTRHRRALRRLRGADGRAARRRRDAVDHPQRAVGRGVPRARRGRQGAGDPRLGDGAARGAQPARLARDGGGGAASGGRAGDAGRDHAEPRARQPCLAVGRGPGGGAADGRLPQPLVPRPRVPRALSRGHGRAVRAALRAARRRWRPATAR